MFDLGPIWTSKRKNDPEQLLIDACEINDNKAVTAIIDKFNNQEKQENGLLWEYCIKEGKLNALRALIDHGVFKIKYDLTDKLAMTLTFGLDQKYRGLEGFEQLLLEHTSKINGDSLWFADDLTELLISCCFFHSHLKHVKSITSPKSLSPYHLTYHPYRALLFFAGFNDILLPSHVEEQLRCNIYLAQCSDDKEKVQPISIPQMDHWPIPMGEIVGRIRSYLDAYRDNLYDCRKIIEAEMATRFLEIKSKQEFEILDKNLLKSQCVEFYRHHPIIRFVSL